MFGIHSGIGIASQWNDCLGLFQNRINQMRPNFLPSISQTSRIFNPIFISLGDLKNQTFFDNYYKIINLDIVFGPVTDW